MVKATVIKCSSGEGWEIIFDTGEATDEDKDAEDEILLRSRICTNVVWDDRGMETMVQPVNVYLLPLEVALMRDMCIGLEGLLLLPTFLQNGQFRRLGWFEIRDDWYDWDALGSSEKPAGQIHDSWHMSLEEEAVILDGCPQRRPLEHSKRKGYYATLLDIQAWLRNYEETAGLDKLNHHLGQEAEYDKHRSERIEEWMRRFRERTGQNLEENYSIEDDRYCNGVVDKTLTERYEDGLRREDYPHIQSFLSCIADSEKFSILSDQLYEDRHGGGYFTIQII